MPWTKDPPPLVKQTGELPESMVFYYRDFPPDNLQKVVARVIMRDELPVEILVSPHTLTAQELADAGVVDTTMTGAQKSSLQASAVTLAGDALTARGYVQS